MPVDKMLQAIKIAKLDARLLLVDRFGVDLRDFRRQRPVSYNTFLALFDTAMWVIPFSHAETRAVLVLIAGGWESCAKQAEDSGRATLAVRIRRNVIQELVDAFNDWYPGAKDAEHEDSLAWFGQEVETTCICRWESRGRKYWVELIHGPNGYSYRGKGCGGGVCGGHVSVEGALTVMQSKVDRGMFLPDDAILSMKRVA